MDAHARFACIALLFASALTSCATSQPGPPPGWSVVDTDTNANSPGYTPGQARTTVFFSMIPWQSNDAHQANFASGWRNDALVGNPYSFQVRVAGGQLLSDGLILRSVATGQELPVVQARVNTSRNVGPPDPSDPYQRPTGTMLYYPSPGQAGFVTRPTLSMSASYSIELVQTCRGDLQYTDLRCPAQPGGDPNGAQAATDVATVLTISPARTPSVPQHGDKFEYELLARNANGETATRITAIYVAPGSCTIQNLLANPNSGNAGDRIMVEWFVSHCYQMLVKTDDPALNTLYFRKVAARDVASEPDFNDSRPYTLPKRLSVRFTLQAADAMGRSPTSRQVTVNVDPCSISKTHPQCPTRCQATPAPSDCPQPPTPVCPVGTGDADRQFKQFNFEVLCSTGGGTAFRKPESEWACTEAEARQAVNNRQVLNCAVVQPTGEWVTPTGETTTGPECPGGATKVDWQFCLACSAATGPVYTTETRKACFLAEAVDLAKANRPGQSCWMEKQGACP